MNVACAWLRRQGENNGANSNGTYDSHTGCEVFSPLPSFTRPFMSATESDTLCAAFASALDPNIELI